MTKRGFRFNLGLPRQLQFILSTPLSGMVIHFKYFYSNIRKIKDLEEISPMKMFNPKKNKSYYMDLNIKIQIKCLFNLYKIIK